MNKNEREKLIDRVMDMVIIGYDYRTIAKKVGVSRRSIVSYVKERQETAVEEMRESAEKQIAHMQMEHKKRIKHLWTIAIDPKIKPGVRLKAISTLQNEESLLIKRKQLIGLLPQEPPVVAIQNNTEITIADSIKKLHPELVERFEKNKTKRLK